MIFAVAFIAALFGGQLGRATTAVAVAGSVQDQTGAVLAGARIELIDVSGTIVETTADAVGAFRFDGVRAGNYQLRATFEGFKPLTTRLRVGGRAPGTQRLVLDLATLTQEITVSNAAVDVTVASAGNVDAVTVDASTLDSLPIFDRDYVATLSRFLDTGRSEMRGPRWS